MGSENKKHNTISPFLCSSLAPALFFVHQLSTTTISPLFTGEHIIIKTVLGYDSVFISLIVKLYYYNFIPFLCPSSTTTPFIPLFVKLLISMENPSSSILFFYSIFHAIQN